MRSCVLALVAVCLCGTALLAQQSQVKPAAFDAGSPDESAGPTDVSLEQLGTKVRLLGKLKQPLGDVVKVQGIVVSGPGKGYEDGPHLRVFRIAGQAIQEFIQIKLADYYGRDEIPNLEAGRAFEMEGFETGGFVGVPAAAVKRAGAVAQTTEHRFRHEFVVFESAEIKLQPFSPADFLGREALIQGRAVNEGGSSYIAAANWKLLVDNGVPWSRTIEGNIVEARGVIRTIGKTSTYRLENGGKKNNARLVDLKDQLGRQVLLRGSLVERNGQQHFRYRGTLVQVEGMKDIGASVDTTGALQLTGILDQVTAMVENSSSPTGETETRTYYIVRKAALKATDSLLAIERAEPVE
jgi:hypothetical protein